MLNVYLAAAYAARDMVRGFARELPEIDVACTSSWIDETHEINAGTVDAATSLTDEQVSGHALQDFEDIDACDVVVLFTNKYLGRGSASGGRHVETGYALALGRYVIVVGEPENVFHRIPGVEVVPHWPAAKLSLLAWRVAELERAAKQAAEAGR